MTGIDYGQADIAAFNQAAAAGTIVYSEEVAREVVRLYQVMIDGLMKIAENLENAQVVNGFGGFRSGEQLQQGFSKKAVDGVAVVHQLIEGAMRMQEASLRAANLLTEADQYNARALAAASKWNEGDGTYI